eukprot:scaffold46132_cov72-Phaeocystis_antarctica.AAC.1
MCAGDLGCRCGQCTSAMRLRHWQSTAREVIRVHGSAGIGDAREKWNRRTNGRFATVRPRLVAGLLHQKGALSSVVGTGKVSRLWTVCGLRVRTKGGCGTAPSTCKITCSCVNSRT